ncbi:MAG: hypothetical protein GXO91_02795 [FCB group bacterium]|nr:hypothetical protein [FCB group bacterium]
MTKVDFVWSSVKDYANLLPLYQHVKTLNWESEFYKIHRHSFRNRNVLKKIGSTIIIAFDQPLNRLRKSGWEGSFIYVEHGLGPVKYYTYKYDFFYEASLLFFPGPVFQRKMAAIDPNFDRGLLGGLPRIDNLVNSEIDREELCNRYGLEPELPVILFAPTWGGKYGADFGIRNARYLQGLPNVIIAPHPSDYRIARKYGGVIPEKKGDINPLIRLADVVVSDVSSILAEAAILDTPVVQIELPAYPGCFPEREKRKTGIRISEALLRTEEQTDRIRRPFKIAYLDEDWVMGHTCKPEDLQATVEQALQNPGEFSAARKYWAQQSCWKADGRTCIRMAKMISHHLNTGEIKQVEN